MSPKAMTADPKRRGKRDRAWTAEEDSAIKKLVVTGQSWDLIASQLPGASRTPTQCRERWQVYFTDKKWTIAEDEEIDRLQKEWGNKWSQIAKALSTGRNHREVRTRWKTRYRSKERSKNRQERTIAKEEEEAMKLDENVSSIVENDNQSVIDPDSIDSESSGEEGELAELGGSNKKAAITAEELVAHVEGLANAQDSDDDKEVTADGKTRTKRVTISPTTTMNISDSSVAGSATNNDRTTGVFLNAATPNESDFQTHDGSSFDDVPLSTNWIDQMAATVKQKFSGQKQHYEQQIRALGIAVEELRREKQEQRCKIEQQRNTLAAKKKESDSKICSMTRTIGGLKTELDIEKQSNKEMISRIENMEGLQSEMQATIERLKEQLAQEKKTSTATVKSIMEKQKKLLESAGASQQIANAQLEAELQRAKAKIPAQQQVCLEQKQRAKDLESNIETMAGEHSAYIEIMEKEHSQVLSRMKSAHKEEVESLNAQLQSLQELL